MNNPEQRQRLQNQIERVKNYNCTNRGMCEVKPTKKNLSQYSNFMPAPAPFDLGKCMSNCKAAFPHGPINQKKCIDGCNAQAQQASEQLKLYNDNYLKSVISQQQFQTAQLQANTLLQPDLTSMKYQFEIEQQKLQLPGFTIDRDKVLPIAIGIAVVGLLVAFLLTSKN